MDNNEKKDFAQRLVDELQDIHPDYEYNIHDVTKNNETLTAITVRPENSNIGPCIYIDNFIEEYNDGRSIDEIAELISDISEQAIAEMPSISIVNNIDVFENVNEKVFCTLVGNDNNPLLDNMVHTPATEDMSYIYKLKLDDDKTIPINNSLLEKWNITLEELHNQAIVNTPIISEPKIEDMLSLMADMMGMDKQEAKDMFGSGPEMIVVSNEEKVLGAVSIMNPEVQDKLVDLCAGDFYILPSSVHEVIVIPAMDITDVSLLTNMVKEVNANEVAPQDRLLDRALAFDSEERKIVRAEDLEKDKSLYQFPVNKIMKDLEKKQESEKKNDEKAQPGIKKDSIEQ